MNVRKNISINDYEIGEQRNYDLLDFVMWLKNSDNEPEKKEYHHSLFYPILSYCIEVLNSTKDPSTIKFKVGLNKYNEIYVTVGREMYDLFFLEKAGNIDDVEIEFNLGKNNFLLTSIHKSDENFKEIYKKICKIKTDDIIKLEPKEDQQFKQFIQNKKEAIISKFLMGYAHQESILKAFEGKIGRNLLNLPNLIFKKRNKYGKTIEEIDQIYLTKFENQKLTQLAIDGFNYFHFTKYSDGVEEIIDIYPRGKKLELISDNLYFLEIKHSIRGLDLQYNSLRGIKISSKIETKSQNSSISSYYKRDELTDLGNAFLTFKTFNELISDILPKGEKKQCNLLFIVDSDFEEDMLTIFEKCLERDKQIIKECKLSLKLYLIYTQPDLALQHFIKETWDKKDIIKKLSQNLDNKNTEIQKQNDELAKQNEEIKRLMQTISTREIERKILNLQYLPVSLDKKVIDFVKKRINEKNSLVLIGLYEKINDNHTYICPSPNLFQKEIDKEEILTLIDLKTFNKVQLNDLNGENEELYFSKIIEDYELYMKNLNIFNEIYIMVDFIFLKNISFLVNNNILENYNITIYMLQKENFIMHLKKENAPIQLITIKKEECENPLFKNYDDSQNYEIYLIEEFAKNYINLLRLRKFMEKQSEKLMTEKCYLFDFKGRINYILELYKKPNSDNKNKKSCFIQIGAGKDMYNILLDKFPDDYIKNKDYINFIFVRRTEFGNSFTKEELISILNYNFNININPECENRITWKDSDKNLFIDETSSKNTGLIRLIKYNCMLPIFLLENKNINIKNIQLIEYLYFLFLPLLIQENPKPKVLIISDDYGILNNYYQKIFGQQLDILFASTKNKNEEIPKEKIILENNNKIDVDSLDNVFKRFQGKKATFDLIILENNFHKNNNDTSIPSIENNYSSLLTPNGIFSLNIRSCSLYEQGERIKLLKKKFKNIKIINFRMCSDFLICFNHNEIKILKYIDEKYPKILELENIGTYIYQFIKDIEI